MPHEKGPRGGNFALLASQGEHCSEREQRAEAAERELTRLKLLWYLSKRIGDEIHVARVAVGISQAAMAKQAGISRSKAGRIERGEYQQVPLVELTMLAAVVGLELSVRAFPVGPPLRDHAHAALLERFRQVLHPSLSWSTEVPLPNANDLRAWDAMVRGGDFSVCLRPLSQTDSTRSPRTRSATPRAMVSTSGSSGMHPV